MEGECESDEEGARGGRLREGKSEITFDQEEFAGLASQYLKRCVNGQAWGWEGHEGQSEDRDSQD